MRVREVKFELALPNDQKRSPGLHLSTILRDLALCTGVLDEKYRDPEDSNVQLMGLGMAAEDWLTRTQHPEIFYHPGEEHKDGIAMTPDGVTDWDDVNFLIQVDRQQLIVNEFKLTMKSSREILDHLRTQSKKVILWLWQIMAYCYACDTLAAQLHVWFIRGDYSKDMSGDPVEYRIFQLAFDPEELRENWEMILNHKSHMEQRNG